MAQLNLTLTQEEILLLLEKIGITLSKNCWNLL